jgi:F-type H+-transporting ATPase subunit delta
MFDVRVSRRYATALFDAASRANVVRAVEDDLQGVQAVLDGDAKFRSVLLAPVVSVEEKLALLSTLFGDRVTALTMQVLRVMLEKHREPEIAGLYREFAALRRTSEGVTYATVTAATPLTPEQKDAVVARVASQIGRNVEAQFLVDATVLGGVKVAFDNVVLDGTARGTLRRLRERLRNEVLKQN